MAVTSKSGTLAICIIFPIFGLVATTLRFYVRRVRRAGWNTDDYLCIPGLVLCTAFFMLYLAGVGCGVVFDNQVHTDRKHHLKSQIVRLYDGITMAMDLIWPAGNACIKLSTIFLCRRIFISAGRRFNIISISLIVFVTIWMLYAILAVIFSCGKNVKAAFAGDCSNDTNYYLTIVVVSMDSCTDLCILLLPLPYIFKLHMRWWQKIMLVLIFAMGSLALVASINNMFIFILSNLSNEGSVEGTPNNDYILGNIMLYNWQGIEVGIGLIASNIPVLKPLWGEALSTHAQRGWHSFCSGVRTMALWKLLSKTNGAGISSLAVWSLKRSQAPELQTVDLGRSLGLNSILERGEESPLKEQQPDEAV